MERPKISKFKLELKGNELMWLIKLAKAHSHTKTYMEATKDNEKLRDFIRKLLLKVTYNFGTSENEYILMLKKDLK